MLLMRCEQGGIIFAKGFGAITDMQLGPDGYLYLLNLRGSIYRIIYSSASYLSI